MAAADAFDLIAEERIEEVNALARHYRHKKTGAEVLSLINDDENKVFGVSFATPPEDSTGIAHILEHSVLCGSEKFPVKKPFVEMLKGSLHTFLNAMTFPDKTVYPVASQNLADFYNLTEVYLDAVFFPLLSRETFLQEGWHYELEDPAGPLAYKGVVFNEMKGGYSSPDQVFRVYAQNSLFPDTTYGLSSGGDPRVMPDLTFEQFSAFHKRHYHPSNAQFIFYGDDDPEKRLDILATVLDRFEPSAPAGEIALQPRFSKPRRVEKTYPADEENTRNAFVSVNWLLEDTADDEENLARAITALALFGTSASPLHKRLTESGLGEAVMAFLNGHSREPWFYAGMRGVDPADADKLQALILDGLEDLARDGVDAATIEATVNSYEFQLRENNTGGYPRGIIYFFSALNKWLYGGNPLDGLKYEKPLAAIKARLAAGERIVEDRIRSLLLDNPHRTTLVLKADKDQAAREEAAERARLDAARSAMSEAEIGAVIETTKRLKTLQNAPDNPEDLARIPTLTLKDLPREGMSIPGAETAIEGVRVLTHDLPTNGIVYLDLAFDLKAVPADLLPLVPVFSRALTQTGTSREDFVALTQRIGRSTGGVSISRLSSAIVGSDEAATMLIARGKATADRGAELAAVMGEVLTDANFANRDRIRQIVGEDKARFEAGLVPSGHQFALGRVRAGLHEADWVNEQTGGISQLFFLRELARRIETDWEGVQQALEALRGHLVNSAALVANLTADGPSTEAFMPELASLLSRLPRSAFVRADWGTPPAPRNEGLTIPAQVNYVAKGANLKALGYAPEGSFAVVNKFLRTSWLWDKIRVEGGAYGGFSLFDSLSGDFAFGSYRDPNLTATLDVYDATGDFLRKGISEADLVRSIIGVISDLDPYQLPDAKGYTALVRALTNVTDAHRQARREQVLSTTTADFTAAAEYFDAVARHGHVAVLGSAAAIEKANAERNGFLSVTRVL
ncbi:insulinase family protein [Pelagibacterium montanilacus]|uniref:insulinase family protein n=1 Tax=Pelagibacterium montanilacus TaxID=2185280 RepID=UPI000F8EC0A1|nr:insulinase family protein [Pelagibacterium montanilacus]